MRREVIKTEKFDIEKVVTQTALNLRSMENLLQATADNVASLEGRTSAIEERMSGYEGRERIDRNRADRLKLAVKEKVNSVLGIKTDGRVTAKESMATAKKYRSAFLRRCYLDARSKSRMGTPYYETYSRDYDEVMRYIENWEPEVSYNGKTGTSAYIEYLDDLRNA